MPYLGADLRALSSLSGYPVELCLWGLAQRLLGEYVLLFWARCARVLSSLDFSAYMEWSHANCSVVFAPISSNHYWAEHTHAPIGCSERADLADSVLSLISRDTGCLNLLCASSIHVIIWPLQNGSLTPLTASLISGENVEVLIWWFWGAVEVDSRLALGLPLMPCCWVSHFSS